MSTAETLLEDAARAAGIDLDPRLLAMQMLALHPPLAEALASAELAGHRTPDPHDCFLMDCKSLGNEVGQLQEALTLALTRAYRGVSR